MRKLLYINLFVAICFLSCKHHQYPPSLLAADSLSALDPDSSLRLLAELGNGMAFPTKADRMYYELLKADAQNKAYVDFTTDSILLEVANYYDRHGSANERMRAHYLLGCSYRDMGESPMALQCYQDAVDQADTLSHDCNYKLLTSIYGQMAELFHNQNLPNDEIEARKNCQKYSLLGRDTSEFLRCCQLMVKPYFLLRDTNSMLKVLDDVYQLYADRRDHVGAASVYSSSVYIDQLIKEGNLDEAGKRIAVFESFRKRFDSDGNLLARYSTYYYIKHLYFIKGHQIDSAEHYARKLVFYPHEHQNAYRALLAVYQVRRNTDSIIKYARLYEYATDTLHNRMRTVGIQQMASMYNYQRYQKLAADKERSAERIKMVASVLLIFFMFILSAVVKHYRSNQRKRAEKILRLLKEHRGILYKYNKVSEELAKLKNKDISLLEDKENEIVNLKRKLVSYREALSNIKSHDKLDRFRKCDLIPVFKEKSIGKKSSVTPNNDEWESLVLQFSSLSPVAYAAIGEDRILSPQELWTCILLLSGFSNGEIAVLLNGSPQLITNIKYRINKKLFGEDSATTLMVNLTNLLG